MARVSQRQLPFGSWPAADQKIWQAVFKAADLFDEGSNGSHLSTATREALRVNYAQYLRFISECYTDLLHLPLDARINRELVSQYVNWLRSGQSPSTIPISLRH